MTNLYYSFQLMKHVRLPLISREFLMTHVDTEVLVRENAECKELLLEGNYFFQKRTFYFSCNIVYLVSLDKNHLCNKITMNINNRLHSSQISNALSFTAGTTFLSFNSKNNNKKTRWNEALRFCYW